MCAFFSAMFWGELENDEGFGRFFCFRGKIATQVSTILLQFQKVETHKVKTACFLAGVQKHSMKSKVFFQRDGNEAMRQLPGQHTNHRM